MLSNLRGQNKSNIKIVRKVMFRHGKPADMDRFYLAKTVAYHAFIEQQKLKIAEKEQFQQNDR